MWKNLWNFVRQEVASDPILLATPLLAVFIICQLAFKSNSTAVANMPTSAPMETLQQTVATTKEAPAAAAPAPATPAPAPQAPAPAVAQPAAPAQAPAPAAAAAPVVPVSALLAGLASQNQATLDEALLQLASRPDAIPGLLEMFAEGDVFEKKRAWAGIKAMGDTARTQLLAIVRNPMAWAPNIRGAAREILVKGFHQHLDGDGQEAQSAPANPPDNNARQGIRSRVGNLVSLLAMEQEELRGINRRLRETERFGRSDEDAELARDLRRQREQKLSTIAGPCRRT